MTIYVDTSSNSLVISPNDIRRCLPPNFTAGDTVPITLAFLVRNPQPINTGQPVFNYVDMSAAGIVLSFGPYGALPTAGTFQLTFGANTTPALAYDISQYDLEVALNSLASITAAGGVSVLGSVGGPFQVTFGNTGTVATMTSPANALFPASTVTIATTKAGSSSNPAVQVVTLGQSATVEVDSWTPQSAAAITVAQISGNLTQRITIPAGTYGGTFTLTLNGQTTTPIPWNAQADLMASIIGSLPGIANVTVWAYQNYWDITITGNTYPFTGTAAGLIIPLTLSGSLILTPQAVLDLLQGEDGPVLVPFQIQQTVPAVLTLFNYVTQLTAP